MSNGQVANCDDDNYEKLNVYSWSLHAHGYPITKLDRAGITMHLLIYMLDNRSIPAGHEIDHINGNKLLNTRDNLRVVTRQQNRMNSKKAENCRSKYKGVSFCNGKNTDPDVGRWTSRIQHPITKQRIWLGNFTTQEEAAEAYDNKAIELFGEFAKLNFAKE